MVDLEEVGFSYGDRLILDRVSFHCERGETLGIVGRSGVGKSTILHIIAGALSPTSGRVTVDSRPPTAATLAHQIGYVFQTPTLFPWLSVRDNTALAVELGNRGRRGAAHLQAAVSEALTRAQIIDAANAFPAQLSGGMQTRAAIARAIVNEPDVLLLDEPFGALDDLTKEALYVDIQDVASRCATILVTHTLPEVVLLCDRALVIRSNIGSGAASIVHVADVPFQRPRTPDLYADPEFIRLHRELREQLL